MKSVLLLLTVVSAMAAETTLIVSKPFSETITNAPVVVLTLPDPVPVCPICHGLTHHEYHVVKHSSFEVVKQVTEYQWQKRTNIIYYGPVTNWYTTNAAKRVYNKTQQPGYSSPPPLP